MNTIPFSVENLMQRANIFVQNVVAFGDCTCETVEPAVLHRFSQEFVDLGVLLKDALEREADSCGELTRSGEAFARIMAPLVAKSAIATRFLEKPLGYAGDYETIQCLYKNIAEGAVASEKIADAIFLDNPATRAVRNRRAMIVERIRQMVSSNDRPISVLSLACGPAAEVFDVLADPAMENRVRFHLVDIDPRALRFVEERASALGIMSSLHLHRHDINRLVVNGFARSGLPSIDFAYSVGLIDYFGDRHVVRLINFAHECLTENGQLTLGNFHPHNPVKSLMDWVVEWRLNHRNSDTLHAILEQSRFGRPFDRIDFEPEGVQAFATIGMTGSPNPAQSGATR